MEDDEREHSTQTFKAASDKTLLYLKLISEKK